MNTDELPPILEAKLSDFRRRVWIVKLAEGLLAACFGIALSYVLVFTLDRFMETPAWLRGALLASGAAVLGFGVPLKWHRWVWRQRRLEDAARLLRRKFPRLGDQLLGIVELARQDSVSGRSETLVHAAMAQAAEAVKDQDFTRAVPHARHRAWGWAVGGVAALAVAAFITVSDAARNALARWLTPWREVDRYTFARVDQLPKNLVVPYAEPFSLPVKLSNDTKWSPERGTGRIEGQPEVNVALQNGGYPLAFPPQKSDAPMKISLGDVRKTLQVEPRTRPELATLTARLRLPAYLQYKTEPSIEVRGGSISVLKGSEVSFVASASRALADAEMDGTKQKVEGEKLLTNYSPVENSGERRFNWRDALGLAPREPLVLKVQAVEDEAPRITARRDSQETVVLDTEVLTFDLSMADDFGVQRAGLEWVGEKKSGSDDQPLRGDKIAIAGNPEKRELDARATFCASRENVAPQTLQVRAWVEDYLPGRKRAYSQSFILHILNKQEHALWLTEQFAKWLQVARESYEREQQLHQTNKELRELSAAELDRPENRRKVMQQAASERANADRLDNITQMGKSLVEQATHNPEFEAKRLESWASMLKDLRNIAAERMPSVADLLKQSSNAATKNMASSNPGKPSPGDQKSQPSSSQTPSGKPSPGDQKSQPSTAQNPSGKPPEGSQQNPGESKPSAPQITTGEQTPSSEKSKPSAPGEKPQPPTPSLADNEKGFFKPEDKKPDENEKPKPGGSGGKFGLPQTNLAAAPSDKKPEEENPPESPAQDKMQKAVAEQRDLLAEFSKVADQLSEIMAGLEASTFVKRLKLASRTQMTVASDLNSKTLSAFGLERKDVTTEPATHVDAIAGREKDQSEVVRVIQSDLEAYYQRRQDERFKNILDQMKKAEIVGALLRTGDQTGVNLSGRSIASSEFWADTLDRWAEELVSAAESSKSKPGSGESASLPPEIVLMVMQALRDEMKLRDETREMENARPGLTTTQYQDQARPLARKQERNVVLAQSATDAILMLPEGDQKFKDELKLLGAVRQVMDEAGGILDKPDTGPEAIAAETEAIELLLQAKRQSKGGGGGGGGGNPGGGGSGTASGMSLAELGPGADSPAQSVVRPVGQQTGRAGREFPEEFKSGLDAYFNKLEGQGGAKP